VVAGQAPALSLRRQYVWSPAAAGTLVLQDANLDGDAIATGAGDQRRYVLQDVRGDVVALVNLSGQATNRWQYGPFGQPEAYGTIANPTEADWCDLLYRAGLYDHDTGTTRLGGLETYSRLGRALTPNWQAYWTGDQTDIPFIEHVGRFVERIRSNAASLGRSIYGIGKYIITGAYDTMVLLAAAYNDARYGTNMLATAPTLGYAMEKLEEFDQAGRDFGAAVARSYDIGGFSGAAAHVGSAAFRLIPVIGRLPDFVAEISENGWSLEATDIFADMTFDAATIYGGVKLARWAGRASVAVNVDTVVGPSLGQVYPISRFAQLRKALARYGVELRTNADKFINKIAGTNTGATFSRHRTLMDKLLGRDGKTILAVRKGATTHEVLHELRHFNQWRKFANKSQYWGLLEATRAAYVYEWFRNGPLWKRLTPVQQVNEYRTYFETLTSSQI